MAAAALTQTERQKQLAEMTRIVDKLAVIIYKLANHMGVKVENQKVKGFADQEEQHTIDPLLIAGLDGGIDPSEYPGVLKANDHRTIARQQQTDVYWLGREWATKYNPHYKGKR